MPMLREDLGIKALCHITSDGFLNLRRFNSKVGYVINQLPDPQPIFKLIEDQEVDGEEMFKVFNMGIGFCVVAPPGSAGRIKQIASGAGFAAWEIGYCTDDADKRVEIVQRGIVSNKKNEFVVAS